MKILGKDLLPAIVADTKSTIEDVSQNGITPTLCIVKSVNAEDVNRYIDQKVKNGAELGITVRVIEYPPQILSDKAALTAEIQKLNADPSVHGILFQKPSHPNVDDALEQLVSPVKDVDGFLPASPHRAPVYSGVMRVLEHIFYHDFPEVLQSKTFVVLGKGKTGGGPVITGLKKDGINSVYVIDSKTSVQDRTKFMQYASVIVSAVGVRNPIDPQLIPAQSILIDFGVHFENGKIQPDFAEADIQDRVAYYTTTPGGIGRLTVAYLMNNVVNAARSLT